MDFEQIRSQTSIREYADAHLERKGRDTYACPSCGSGTGPKRTAAFHIKDERFKCFSCGVGGDIFDLAGIVEGTDNKIEQLEAVCRWAGIDPEVERGRRSVGASAKTAQRRDDGITRHREAERAYLEACRERMAEQIRDGGPGIEYMRGRGFTDEEVERFGIGYDPNPRHGWQDENGEWHNGPRVTIPWPGSDYYHIDRAIDDRAKAVKYDKPSSDEVGPQPLFNPGALKEKAFFAVEGALDALALMACGYPAVALAGTGSSALVNEVVGARYRGVVLEALDNDKAGEDAGHRLIDVLTESGVDVMSVDLNPADRSMSAKDPAEMLERDRSILAREAGEIYSGAIEQADRRAEERYSEALTKLQVVDPATALMGLYTLADYDEPTPTGIAGLDRVLDGGLRRGLTVLGAVSSLGKTTLAVQIADNIASSGRPVLFVTIEQSAREIVAKSISRIMKQETGGQAGTCSTQTLTNRTSRAGFNDEKQAALDAACCTYSDTIAPNLRILEGTEQPGVSAIAEVARMMAEHEDNPPVVFIDYLQLLAPDDDRITEKQATDRNVMRLRHLARDLGTPVFVISSLNRSSYSGSISLDSFKESGGIEYGADVLLGLQPYHMAEQLEDVTEAKRRAEANGILKRMRDRVERPCEVVVLKYRNGALPRAGIPVTFMTVSSMFRDGVDES